MKNIKFIKTFRLSEIEQDETPKKVKEILKIFRETIDESFDGERAEFAKTRAEAIANRIQNFITDVPTI